MHIEHTAPPTSIVLAAIETFFELLESGDDVGAARVAGSGWTTDRLRAQVARIGPTIGRVRVDGAIARVQWQGIEVRSQIFDDGVHRVSVELDLFVDDTATDHRAVFVGHTSVDGFVLELESLE
jgi:hypothetical protein